jgi:hypothetical protein
MDIRPAFTQRITTRFMRFRAAFERFDDGSAEAEKVGPNWNVRDLAGHLAYWTAEVAKEIEAQTKNALSQSHSRGRLCHTDDHSRGRLCHIDTDRVNEEVYHKNRRMSYVMLLPQLRAAEERFLAALQSVPDHQLGGETPVRRWIDDGIVDHYDHHWPGLQAAVSRIPPT